MMAEPSLLLLILKFKREVRLQLWDKKMAIALTVSAALLAVTKGMIISEKPLLRYFHVEAVDQLTGNRRKLDRNYCLEIHSSARK